MSNRLEYISSFYSDIQAIECFLADYPSKASRLFSKADKSISNLKEMPEMYPIYMDIPSFRFIVIEEYLIFYKFIQENGIVEVHRMLHGRMDIPVHMQETFT